MKRSEKFIIGYACMIIGLVPSLYFANKKAEDSIKPYIEENLVTIIQEQEDELEISHPDLPNIIFEYPEWAKSDYEKATLAGSYDAITDTIYLPTKYGISPEKTFYNLIRMNFTELKPYDVKEVLDHELGHYYMDQLAERLGLGDWPVYEGGDFEDFIGTKLISEGIAQYFEKTMSGEEDDSFLESDYPLDFYEEFLDDTIIYEGGYHLVKPIIDEYGKDAIPYLMKHPPKKSELFDLFDYQEKILEDLFYEIKIKPY